MRSGTLLNESKCSSEDIVEGVRTFSNVLAVSLSSLELVSLAGFEPTDSSSANWTSADTSSRPRDRSVAVFVDNSADTKPESSSLNERELLAWGGTGGGGGDSVLRPWEGDEVSLPFCRLNCTLAV
uniref:Uncharacterized protein n=1 Tax=Cacopsylla melanoneura TaxID=428564 RepID=A0A8D8SW80_9HEMI